MDDQDSELREIKREIVESRGLVIKTNNLVNALAADIKGISKKQLEFERRVFWNSAIGNALFVVMVLGAVKFAWDARAGAMSTDVTRAQETLRRKEGDLEELQRTRTARDAADAQASAFYELLRTGRWQEAFDQYDALRKLPLSRVEQAFFADSLDRVRGELSLKSYQLGLDHVRMGRWHEATTAFEEAVRQQESGAHVPGAKLNLARAYRKLGRQRDAIQLLTPLSEASPDREILDDATMLLADCFTDIQAWNDAKTTLRSFVRRFPESPLLNDARSALAELSLKH